MIPRHVHGSGQAAMEVFGFIMTHLPASGRAYGIVTVTQPGTGHWGTARVMTADSVLWRIMPGTLEVGSYAGLRDAQRHMYQRAGLDNSSTVPMAAQHGPAHYAYP